jgi:nicotinate phosphoribosyltransferase
MVREQPYLNLAAQDYSLLTDLYQLTMIACYKGEKLAQQRASFELFARRLPENFGYLVAMGLTQALDYLQNWRFSREHLEALAATGLFSHAPAEFWQLLETGSFTGDVWAVPEGTLIFANEPIVRIEAPLWQAQLVETYLLNTINYQTLIATKAARMRDRAGDEAILLEFGTRRAFSPQGALWAARAALAGGCDGTSNVLAALQLGRKPCGTMAHSLVMALKAVEGTEEDAFLAFARYFPEATLLIDTYDPLAAAEKLAAQKISVKGIRLDSGDLGSLSEQIQHILPETQIYVSGDLDEWEIQRLRERGAPIAGYGIGNRLVTGNPVNGVYKLVEIKGIPTMKKSSQKATYPGRKQIFRHYQGGKLVSDRLGLAEESPEEGEIPLLELFLQAGQLVQELDTLESIQKRTRLGVSQLPEATRQISKPLPLTVNLSPQLTALKEYVLSIC